MQTITPFLRARRASAPAHGRDVAKVWVRACLTMTRSASLLPGSLDRIAFKEEGQGFESPPGLQTRKFPRGLGDFDLKRRLPRQAQRSLSA